MNTNRMNILDLAIDERDLEIREDELVSITNAGLKKLDISREELHRVFAEGVKLMRSRNVKPSDRVRPCAHQTLDGKWEVVLVRYSPLSDPLMQGPIEGRAH